ncbi:hypothetical protein ACLMJK_000971 [Lecanora helva]
MFASKNGSITSYFKKAASSSLPRKRPLPEDNPQESRSRPQKKSPLTSSVPDPSVQQESDDFQSTSVLSSQSHANDARNTSNQTPPSSQHTLPTRTASASCSQESVESGHSKLSPLPDSPSTAIRLTSSAQRLRTGTPLQGTNIKHTGKDQRPEIVSAVHNEDTTRNHTINSSQPLLTSSQRIVRDGEQMIRDSDDESDASFEDMDNWFDRSRSLRGSSTGTDPQLPSPDAEEVDETKRLTRSAARTRKPPTRLSSDFSEPQKTYGFSLQALVKEKRVEDASEDAIARAKSLLESYNQRQAPPNENKRILDPSVIESLLPDHGDEDDISRLKTAIQRTEAFAQGKSWSFFDHDAQNLRSHSSDFPTYDDLRLQRLFGDKIARQQTFLSGYAGEYAMRWGLTEEVLLWMMDALCVEPQDDLRYSYTTTLACVSWQLTSLLTPDYLDKHFRMLNGSAAALDLKAPVVPHAPSSVRGEGVSQPKLQSWLALLAMVAGDLLAESRIHLLGILCRLALDHVISKDYHTINTIEEVFSALIESIPKENFNDEVCDVPGHEQSNNETNERGQIRTVMSSVYDSINDATLRLRLLQTIPVWSPRLILIRQRLAQAFFFQDSHYLNEGNEESLDLKTVSRHLQGPQFTITPTTDFSDLAASIGTLDIVINSVSPPTSPCPQKEATAFNKDIDAITIKINSMFDDIVDTGATHMKKTEAKEVLEGFQRRLEYALRTEPKPKRCLFGNTKVVTLQEQQTMAAWMNKEKPPEPLAVEANL